MLLRSIHRVLAILSITRTKESLGFLFSFSLILLMPHNINIMNQFLINLVGHDDHYLAKKQLIKEIFAYTNFPKSATSKQYLWSKGLVGLAEMHRELLTMQVEIA